MPKRKEPELEPAEQYQRFREAAKRAELAGDEPAFERAFKAVAKPKRKAAPRKKAAAKRR